MRTLSIDFETRSVVNLLDSGVYPYALHETTDIWCMSYAFDDDGVVKTWAPRYPYQDGTGKWGWHTLSFPTTVLDHITAGGILRAHNAQFERIMWRDCLARRYGVIVPDMEQFECSAAEAAVMGLPRSLDGVSRVLGVEMKKDLEGHALMLRMCRPRSAKGKALTWWDVPEKVQRLIEYCEQDVRTEQAVSKHLRRLIPAERGVYLLDQRINDRGVTLDGHLAKQARALVEVGVARSTEEIHAITHGEVEKLSQNTRMLRWVQKQGVATDSLDKASVETLLAGEGLDPLVEKALMLRAEGAKTSLAKITAMFDCVCPDGRIRGTMLYHGASTGRWSGKLIQPHNFPKGDVKGAEEYIPLVLKGAAGYDELDLFEPPLAVVSSLLRSMLTAAPGHILRAADFSGIEARVLAWLAGQDDLVSMFAKGEDAYVALAKKIVKSLGVEFDYATHRPLGKVGVLGCGFGMGWNKLIATAAGPLYNLTLSEDTARLIVKTYRDSNSRITDFWYHLEAAALKAVRQPGTTQVVRSVKLSKRGPFLWLILPSGRPIAYPSPRIIEKETPWGEKRPALECWGVNGITRKWEPYDLYGGLWAENVTQAVARDLLAEAMLRLDRGNYPVIMSVHDEVVCETPEGVGSFDDFMQQMTILPPWAAGCPVAAAGWEGHRYRKA